MTNEIIIDGVDVSGCEYRQNTYYDGMTIEDNNQVSNYCSCIGNECKEYPNCYYKQLLRAEKQIAIDEELQCDMREKIEWLQAELKNVNDMYNETDKIKVELAVKNMELKEKIEAQKDYIAHLQPTGICDICQTKLWENNEKLEKENEALTEKCEALQNEIKKYNMFVDYAMGGRECEYWEDEIIELKKNNDKSKQALAEIAEIAEKMLTPTGFLYGTCDGSCERKRSDFDLDCNICMAEQILQKVKEVLGEN